MKEKSSKKISVTIIKLVAIIVSIIIFSYAWFVNEEQGYVEGVSVGTARTNNIEVSDNGNEGWGTNLSVNMGENFRFSHEVTSDGKIFYKSGTKDENGYPTSFVPAIEGEDYISFDIWFKNDVSVAMFLEDTSRVYPESGTTSNELIYNSSVLGSSLENITRLSGFGDFSRDLIAGAVRVSFTKYYYDEDASEYVLENNPTMVWAPNKNYDVYLDQNDTYIASINSNRPQNYNYINVVNTTTFGEQRVNNLQDTIHASYSQRNAGGDPMLAYIETTPGVEATSGINIKIWVEGNDREAIQALKGGIFKFDLSFVGIQKEFNETLPLVSEEGDSITGFSEGMQYSSDYAFSWYDYDQNNLPSFNEGDIIYVRYKETSTAFASSYVVLNF